MKLQIIGWDASWQHSTASMIVIQINIGLLRDSKMGNFNFTFATCFILQSNFGATFPIRPWLQRPLLVLRRHYSGKPRREGEHPRTWSSSAICDPYRPDPSTRLGRLPRLSQAGTVISPGPVSTDSFAPLFRPPPPMLCLWTDPPLKKIRDGSGSGLSVI